MNKKFKNGVSNWTFIFDDDKEIILDTVRSEVITYNSDEKTEIIINDVSISVWGDKMKRERGQFFTIANPFKVNPFYSWYESIPLDISKEVFLEHFAWSNNIIELLES